MHHQDHEPAFKLAPVAAPHALDLLGNIGNIDRRQFSSAQQAALLDRPSVKVFVVLNGVAGHH